MKKSFLVFALAGLLSLPSVVLAEASWYGSIRAGWKSADDENTGKAVSGVANAGSRWGVKGTSEVSEGLSAVYRFEHNIDSTNASQTTGRLSYVGLSGGFGTLTIGRVDNAALNNAGFVDNSTFLGDSELANKVGNTVSYAASVGAASFQIDVIGDRGSAKDKDVDSAQFGASLAIGENGKIGFGYIDHATMDMDEPGDKGMDHVDSDKQAMLAGKYTIGGMTMHLGYGERKTSTGSKAAVVDEAGTMYGEGLMGGDFLESKNKTTYFGAAGGLGDTGVSYFLQVRNKQNTKHTVTASYLDRHTAYTSAVTAGSITDSDELDELQEMHDLDVENGNVRAVAAADTDQGAKDRTRGKMKDTSKNTPWVLGLSRSLGGGASVHFEYVNKDDDVAKNTSLIALKVDF